MKEGVVTGCDKNQEWLLSWWWENYSKHNSYPVAFADFGMSETGVAWCRKRGIYFEAPEIGAKDRKEVAVVRRKLWEEHWGKKIWAPREIWLRKPFVMRQSPFPFSIWIDLDCKIRGSLEPLFQLLYFGAEIGMKRENETVQETHKRKGFLREDEVNYNSGVVCYQKEGMILEKWIDQIRMHSEEFPCEQQALARALRLYPAPMMELPDVYNWSPSWDGPNPKALIYHFHGGTMKDPALMELFS